MHHVYARACLKLL